jgi:hypothetical protein
VAVIFCHHCVDAQTRTGYIARQALFRTDNGIFSTWCRKATLSVNGASSFSVAGTRRHRTVGTYRRFAKNQSYPSSDVASFPARELRRHYQLMEAGRSHSRQQALNKNDGGNFDKPNFAKPKPVFPGAAGVGLQAKGK